MKLLAVDTATEACSVALYLDGEISQKFEIAPREHSHLVLPMIEQLLAENETDVSTLDGLAFGRGPGSFMGIRIAAGVVQGIAFARDLPVVPISTLRAMAWQAHIESGAKRVITAIDARMKEVYWAAFDIDKDVAAVIDEAVCAPHDVSMPEGDGWVGAGTGWGSYQDVLQNLAGDQVKSVLPECFPSAASIVELAAAEFAAGRTVSAAEAVPVYLRDKVAAKPKKPAALL